MSVAEPIDLRSLQSLFWRLIAAPEGVRAEAEALAHAGAIASSELTFLVNPGTAMSAVERLDVYADMYFYRLRDALAEDFPKVAAWIGPPRFHNLVTDYLLAHPSTSFSLRDLGCALPDFLVAYALTREYPGVADLARLEWARLDVFDETDAEPLTRDDLLANAEQGMTLVPALRLLRVGGAIPGLWKRLEAEDDALPDAGSMLESAGRMPKSAGARASLGICVWRRGFAIFHRSLPADEEACLRLLASRPATVAEVGECLLELQPGERSETRAAERLAALLATWTRDGLLSAAAIAV
jgi:hypothetical protein